MQLKIKFEQEKIENVDQTIYNILDQSYISTDFTNIKDYSFYLNVTILKWLNIATFFCFSSSNENNDNSKGEDNGSDIYQEKQKKII